MDIIVIIQIGGTFGDFEGTFWTESKGIAKVKLADNRTFVFKLDDIYKDIMNRIKRQKTLF